MIIVPARPSLTHLDSFELLIRGEICEIVDRTAQTVANFFTSICQAITSFLDQISEGVEHCITWLFTDKRAERERERVAEERRYRFMDELDWTRSFFRFQSDRETIPLDIRYAPSAPPATEEEVQFANASLALKSALAPYQQLPSSSPDFEKAVLAIARPSLSPEKIENMENFTDLNLFCTLLVRAIVFQGRPVNIDDRAGVDAFKIPDYFKCKEKELKAVRTAFWNLKQESDQLAVLKHIDSEASSIEYSAEAAKVYKSIRAIGCGMHQGNPALMQVLPCVYS